MVTKARFAKEFPELVQHFKDLGRRDPELSTYSYVLMEKEKQVLGTLINELERAGLKLVVPMFDGAIVAPLASGDGFDTQRVIQRVKEICDIDVVEKPWKFAAALEQDVGAKRPRTW